MERPPSPPKDPPLAKVVHEEVLHLPSKPGPPKTPSKAKQLRRGTLVEQTGRTRSGTVLIQSPRKAKSAAEAHVSRLRKAAAKKAAGKPSAKAPAKPAAKKVAVKSPPKTSPTKYAKESIQLQKKLAAIEGELALEESALLRDPAVLMEVEASPLRPPSLRAPVTPRTPTLELIGRVDDEARWRELRGPVPSGPSAEQMERILAARARANAALPRTAHIVEPVPSGPSAEQMDRLMAARAKANARLPRTPAASSVQEADIAAIVAEPVTSETLTPASIPKAGQSGRSWSNKAMKNAMGMSRSPTSTRGMLKFTDDQLRAIMGESASTVSPPPPKNLWGGQSGRRLNSSSFTESHYKPKSRLEKIAKSVRKFTKDIDIPVGRGAARLLNNIRNVEVSNPFQGTVGRGVNPVAFREMVDSGRAIARAVDRAHGAVSSAMEVGGSLLERIPVPSSVSRVASGIRVASSLGADAVVASRAGRLVGSALATAGRGLRFLGEFGPATAIIGLAEDFDDVLWGLETLAEDHPWAQNMLAAGSDTLRSLTNPLLWLVAVPYAAARFGTAAYNAINGIRAGEGPDHYLRDWGILPGNLITKGMAIAAGRDPFDTSTRGTVAQLRAADGPRDPAHNLDPSNESHTRLQFWMASHQTPNSQPDRNLHTANPDETLSELLHRLDPNVTQEHIDEVQYKVDHNGHTRAQDEQAALDQYRSEHGGAFAEMPDGTPITAADQRPNSGPGSASWQYGPPKQTRAYTLDEELALGERYAAELGRGLIPSQPRGSFIYSPPMKDWVHPVTGESWAQWLAGLKTRPRPWENDIIGSYSCENVGLLLQ